MLGPLEAVARTGGLATIVFLASACGLVIDLSVDDDANDDGMDGGSVGPDSAARFDAIALDSTARFDATAPDAAAQDRDRDTAVATDAGGSGAADARGARDATAAADAANLCLQVDCDGDGDLEDRLLDPAHCGACGNRCGPLQICCVGTCGPDRDPGMCASPC